MEVRTSRPEQAESEMSHHERNKPLLAAINATQASKGLLLKSVTVVEIEAKG